jgi:hypothetical protein
MSDLGINIKDIKQKFRSSVRRGTGEAYLLMKKYPDVDFSNEIIKASLNAYAYDRQSEGSRSEYICGLIRLSSHQDKIRQSILKGLPLEKADTWNLQQLFDLALYYAKQGDAEAKKAIYKRYNGKKIKYSEWLGEDVIIKLDGIEGLKYVIRKYGKAMEKNPEVWEDTRLADKFQDQHPELKINSILDEAALTDPMISLYLEKTRKNSLQKKKFKRQKSSYKTVRDNIEQKKIVPLVRIGDLSRKDILRLANDFLAETDRIRQEKYMRVFEKIQFPYDHVPILKLAGSRQKKGDRLVEYACGALKFFKGKDIRELALRKLSGSRSPEDYLDLLVSNYRKGDHRLLTSIAQRRKNEHWSHSLVGGLCNIYNANTVRECRDPLMAIYEYMTCGIHRCKIIEIMLKNRALPAHIRKEISFDSYRETKELLKKTNKSVRRDTPQSIVL